MLTLLKQHHMCLVTIVFISTCLVLAFNCIYFNFPYLLYTLGNTCIPLIINFTLSLSLSSKNIPKFIKRYFSFCYIDFTNVEGVMLYASKCRWKRVSCPVFDKKDESRSGEERIATKREACGLLLCRCHFFSLRFATKLRYSDANFRAGSI